MLARIALAALMLLALPSATAARPAPGTGPVTILVSIDGFRADYRGRGVTPNLDALARAGISGAMRPAFPSKTFPNHWTLVTGLYPEHHGIVGNRMVDPSGTRPPFALSTEDPWWWAGGEPVWVAAEKAGIRTATMFWPGSTVMLGGVRPSDWRAYDAAMPADARVDTVLGWLARPVAERPGFVALYFEAVDSAGHAFGPDAPEVSRAVAGVDAAIGRLREGLDRLGIRANLVVVADHGMAPVSAARAVRLEDFASPGDFSAVEDGPYATLNATPGREAALAAALARTRRHVRCWPKAAIPKRLHYRANARIPGFLCLADVGWLILAPGRTAPDRGGNHGYDPAAPEMLAAFVAAGPGFRSRGRIATFDNVAIEPLLRDLLGLPRGVRRDGSDAPFRRFLVRRFLTRK